MTESFFAEKDQCFAWWSLGYAAGPSNLRTYKQRPHSPNYYSAEVHHWAFGSANDPFSSQNLSLRSLVTVKNR